MHALNTSNSLRRVVPLCPSLDIIPEDQEYPQTWSSTTKTKDLATKAFSANKPEDWICLGKGDYTPMDMELVKLIPTEHFS